MFLGASREDYRAYTGKPPSLPKITGLFFTSAGFRAVCLYRIGHWCQKRRLRIFSALIHRLIFHSCQCTIAMNAELGPGFSIRHCGAIVIGAKTKTGKNCDIRQGVTFGGNVNKEKDGRSHPVVGDNVLVGAGAKILGPVTVGSNVVIGANAVVVKDVPSGSVVGGVPARVLRQDGLRVEDPLEAEIRGLRERLERIEKGFPGAGGG